jgi:hypothetical protein
VRVRFHDDAKEESVAAAEYYAQQREGLGTGFADEVYATFLFWL